MSELEQPRDPTADKQGKKRDWSKIFFSFVVGVGAFTLTMLSLGVAVVTRPGFDPLIIILFVLACVLWITALFPWFRPHLTRKETEGGR